MEAMCHNPRERKSKSLDKGCTVERERAKRRKKKREKKRRKRKERAKREKGEIIFLVLTSLREGRRRGVRSSTFFLRSMEIGPSVFVGVRGKVHLRDESFA